MRNIQHSETRRSQYNFLTLLAIIALVTACIALIAPRHLSANAGLWINIGLWGYLMYNLRYLRHMNETEFQQTIDYVSSPSRQKRRPATELKKAYTPTNRISHYYN